MRLHVRTSVSQKTDDGAKKKKIKELDTKRYNVELSGDISTVSSSSTNAVRFSSRALGDCVCSSFRR